jgi:hypothetical protein
VDDMSETRTTSRGPALQDPFRENLPSVPGADGLPPMLPAVQGAHTDAALAAYVTAQKVAVKRSLPDVIREAKALGAAAGPEFYYRIPFKSRNRQTGEVITTYVEGPSIDCAMACATLYGNVKVGATVVRETQSTWTFAATFMDLEKGVTVVREFQQRKAQDTGMKDAARQADIVFQIGQSKAIRNVIVAALPLVVNAAFSAAKDSMLREVEANPDKAERLRNFIVGKLEELGVDLARVQRVVTRRANDWTPADLCRLYADLIAIRDGQTTAADLWPPLDQAAPRQEEVSEIAVANRAVPEPQDDGMPPEMVPVQRATPTAADNQPPEPAKPARQQRRAEPPPSVAPADAMSWGA